MQKAGYDLSKFSGKHSPGSEVFARFPGGILLALSVVGFNAEKTRAMVTVQHNCFPSLGPPAPNQVCRQGEQILMEKADGRWVRAEGGCVWIA